MTADVAGHFAPARRMAHVDRLLQVEFLHQGRQVVGVSVHVVAVPRLARPAMPAPVVRDATVPARGQKRHLVLESVSAQRPAVTEDHGLSRAPILVIALRSVFGDNCAHGDTSLIALEYG